MKKLISLFLLSLGVALSQVPTPLPQPNTPTFPVSALELFPTYDRASYEAKFGKQAPAFDVNRAPKAWFDSTATTGTKNYMVVGSNVSIPGFDTITLNASEASTVNLPGLPHFDKYVGVTTSNVAFSCNIPGCQSTPVGVILQSTRAAAEALKAEIGDTSLTVTEVVGPTGPGSAFFYSKIDPNSPIGIFLVGSINVGQALASRNSKGIGYPGTWAKDVAGYSFRFSSLNDGANTGAFLRVPVRDLLPNEQLTVQLAGIIPIPVVSRTDLTPTTVTTSTGGGFSDDDRAILNQILQVLKKVTGQ